MPLQAHLLILRPATEAFLPAGPQRVIRRFAGHFGQLASLAQHNPGHQPGQGGQLPGQIAFGFNGVQLLHGAFYGTIHATAVTHGCAPVF